MKELLIYGLVAISALMICAGAVLFIGGLITESWLALIGMILVIGSLKLVNTLRSPGH